ncbi:RING-H2 finger protein ATL54-like [Impatiens glandulifera]|uniref:RING-H2 finger protein ATL54-like n=1 Tax=Impatiens glandulifera TaxID=253017 RepID=UPI001FB08678|nr:RING-H2 finger protein ATL54-like [Impatiens glandulifera]
MFGSGTNLITTIIGFGMSATFIIFVCSRLICGRIRRRAESSRQMLEISINDIEQPAEQRRRDGLEDGVVAAIPTVKFSQQGLGSIEDAECSICLGEYEEKQVLRILPGCGHNFHIGCIDLWLRKHSTCPVCRLPIHHESFITKYYVRSPILPSSPESPLHHHHVAVGEASQDSR